jgi:hypothetical protein
MACRGTVLLLLYSKKTHVSITKSELSVRFREKISVYSENMKRTNTLYGRNAESLNIKACGTYNYHFALKG